ncbi:MAG: deacetylase [Burkholderiales bacterium]
MPETPFIVTIDTEGDDLWSKPREITTRNAAYLPRFQALCERFGFKPVYLTNYEMATCATFVEFARDVLARDAGEVGMHLHAWNSPPLVPLTGDDFRFQPFLIEYPEPVMREKIRTLTRLLEDRFGCQVVSHRAGRVAFDGRYAAMLLDEAYCVDCSVTPGVDWRPTWGDPAGNGGTDYSSFPGRPYFVDPQDISRPAAKGLLEVPVTIRPSALYLRAPWVYRIPLLRRVANRASPGLSWLNPAENRLDAMLRAARGARREGVYHLEFMLHSSELMPGGSPSYRDRSSIERLYEQLEVLFGELSSWCRGTTLKEFHAELTSGGYAHDPA